MAELEVQWCPLEVEVAEEVVDIDDLRLQVTGLCIFVFCFTDLSVSGWVSQSFFLFPASPLSPPAAVGLAATLA